MPKSKNDSRARLLQAAVKVSHRRGFGQTAIADIAKEAKVPLGNVYYYYKTKDEIGRAIIDARLAHFRTQLEELDQMASPAERLCGFVQIKINHRDELARIGCPVGTLCSELHKHGGSVAEKSRILFTVGLAWMEAQFKELGMRGEARALAVHLMAALQGVSVLAHTFHDPRLISAEGARLKKWVRSLER